MGGFEDLENESYFFVRKLQSFLKKALAIWVGQFDIHIFQYFLSYSITYKKKDFFQIQFFKNFVWLNRPGRYFNENSNALDCEICTA